jgi:hypothetical protein
VLVVGLVGRCTSLYESLDRRLVFGILGGIVVVALVVIPGDRERVPGVRRLQAAVALIEGMLV